MPAEQGAGAESGIYEGGLCGDFPEVFGRDERLVAGKRNCGRRYPRARGRFDAVWERVDGGDDRRGGPRGCELRGAAREPGTAEDDEGPGWESVAGGDAADASEGGV